MIARQPVNIVIRRDGARVPRTTNGVDFVINGAGVLLFEWIFGFGV